MLNIFVKYILVMSNTEDLIVEQVVEVHDIDPILDLVKQDVAPTMNFADVYPGQHKVDFVGVPPMEPTVEPTVGLVEIKQDVQTEPTVEVVITPIEIMKPAGCCDKITAKLNDQDFMQKTSVYISFIFELYRVVMGSFLILFVPQKCGEDSCTIFQPVNAGNRLNDAAFGVNILTFCLFLGMYYAEIKRETQMITYLHVNLEEPCDNDAVGEALCKLPEEKKLSILRWDKLYLRSGQFALVGFIANAVLSSIAIYDNFLDGKTTSSLITNILFMLLKIHETQSITNTDQNIFYSAYLNERVQFNDVDPDKMEHSLDKPSIESGVNIANTQHMV
jgi:hypothetical protein